MNLQKGTYLQGNKYQIIDILGQGGFGTTYLAFQHGLNRKVAIKEFFMKDFCQRGEETTIVTMGTDSSRDMIEQYKQKFIKEAQTIAQFQNSHIIKIHDIFEENGTAYYVMELLEAGDLKSRIIQNGIPEEEAIEYIRQIAEAISYIHKQKILHLDIKPSNVLFRSSDELVLIDFGISKHYNAENGGQTSSTPIGISEGYAPLEQYETEGVKEFSPATDIYSLGATLYHLVTGKRPPSASQIMNNGLPQIHGNITDRTKTVIQKAMSFRQSERPQTIDDFMRLLNELDSFTEKVSIPKQAKEEQPKVVKTNNTNIKTIFKKCIKIIGLGIVSIFIIFFIIGLFIDEEGNTQAQENKVERPIYNITAAKDIQGNLNCGHEFVDLGLSVMWATCNIGASSPEDAGNYFAWGEVKTKKNYSEENSKTFKKDIQDFTADTRYDAAAYNWKGSWRMPIKAEVEELKTKCKWQWDNVKKGYLITGPNGNSIYLPAVGYKYLTNEPDRVGLMGYYWTSTEGEDNKNAYKIAISEDLIHISSEGSNKFVGSSIRPVCYIK